MFRKVLIANRGAIACRIIRTLRNMGIGSVAVYSEADRHSLHVQQADEALLIGPPPATQSYLSVGAILEAARKSGAEAIHPGYGFLSENAEFAQVCADSGVVFIGPTPEQMRVFGLKHTARAMAHECDVPLLPGTGLLAGAQEAVEAAEQIGYPVMLKSTAGGGGIGMRLCRTPEELAEYYEAVESLSRSSFGSSELFLEKFVVSARHIEVQIFGDGKGTVIALGERDCSPQRRNQKVIEETPAPGIRQSLREKMFAAAVGLGEGGGVSIRWYCRVYLRQQDGGFLLPRSQHAAAGGARRYGAGHGHRSGGVDGAAGGGRVAGSESKRIFVRRGVRFRCGFMRRTRRRIFSLVREGSRM